MIRFFDEAGLEKMFKEWFKKNFGDEGNLLDKVRIYVTGLHYTKSSLKINKRYIRERDFYSVEFKLFKYNNDSFESKDGKMKILIERMLLNNSNTEISPQNSILEENLKCKVVI